MTNTDFCKFTSIESFAHVWKSFSLRFETPTAHLGRKIKLHGTNAGARIAPDGAVTAQSKSRDITPEKDNAGFAKWLHENAEAFSKMRKGQTLTIFGEWAGLGIQKKDAVTTLKEKYFFVFSAQLGDYMVTNPRVIETMVPDLDNLLVIPWDTNAGGGALTFNIDFGDVDKARVFTEMASADAEAVGERDPLIASIFEIEGPGEGHVYMPLDSLMRDDFSRLTFKVKAESHRVKQTEKAASVKVEIPEDVQDFVKKFVTDARGEQAVAEACDGLYEKRFMSLYMKWMGQDIKKESEVELAEMGKVWKDVTAPLNANVARWYLQKCEAI